MPCDCRKPINCYNDKSRYTTMFVLYTIDLIFFIIRLSLVCNDISKRTPDTMPFLLPILIFDLIASVPIIICNLLYVIMRNCIQPLTHRQRSFETLWHIATMTCIRLKCHKDRPQSILLTRILFIVCSFLLKFICFTVGAACSVRFKSEGTAYTIIAAFALLGYIFVITIELINFLRLWKYNPTETRNKNTNQTYTATPDGMIEKTCQRHLAFFHHSLLNDQNAQSFRHSKCREGVNCKSDSLHHYLFYHSLKSERHTIKYDAMTPIERRSFIAFYQTTKQEALDIAQNGFPYGDDNPLGYKDYLHLKQTIFFTRSCEEDSFAEAVICVRINPGRMISIMHDGNLNLNKYFGFGDGEYDTVYVESTYRFYLRMPAQIEKWIIIIKKDVLVNDSLDGTSYQPCT